MDGADVLLAAVDEHAWAVAVLNTDEAWAGLHALASHVSWWQVLILAVFSAGVRVLKRQLAEQARRWTLEVLIEKASAGTVIWQEKGLGGPAVIVWIGVSHPPHQGAQRDGARALHRPDGEGNRGSIPG